MHGKLNRYSYFLCLFHKTLRVSVEFVITTTHDVYSIRALDRIFVFTKQLDCRVTCCCRHCCRGRGLRRGLHRCGGRVFTTADTEDVYTVVSAPGLAEHTTKNTKYRYVILIVTRYGSFYSLRLTRTPESCRGKFLFSWVHKK